MTTWSRRGILAAGAAGALSACSPGDGASQPTSTSRPPSDLPQGGSPRPTGSRRDWSQLARHVDGTLARPGSSSYDTVRLVENPRYDASRPLAVLTVASAADVATAMAFAQDNGIEVAVRSGGHSYPGWSAGGGGGTGLLPSLVLDCRDLSRISLSGASATIGAGAALAPVYAALGRRGRALAGGSCATVGIGGLTQGGGVGVLTRSMGLTCDAVTSMRVVTADRVVRTVSADQDPDLFWALRGGGGGHAGVVTSFGFRTSAAPTVSTAYLQWPLSAAPQVIDAWQSWAPGADPRSWSTLKALGGEKHPDGPILVLSGTWTGPPARFDAQLAGLLDHVPAPVVRSTHTRTYLEAMLSYAGCADIPVAQCTTGAGGALTREAFGATSHVAYDALTSAGITTLADRVEDAQSSGLLEAGVSMDALGGRVRDLAPDETAFVHRQALATVQYTATFPPGRPRTADAYVRAFRAAMVPYWGAHAYVNYADASIRGYRSAYFGANAARLADVKRTYDPDGFFTQPQDW
jgi:FAD/FMN-containing dehydrogenase